MCCFISDPTLTTDNVAPVIELLNDLDSLSSVEYNIIIIPPSRLGTILRKYSTKGEICNECASYFIHCYVHPSWTELACCLYQHGEVSAVKQLKPFLPVRGKYQVISCVGMNHALKVVTPSFSMFNAEKWKGIICINASYSIGTFASFLLAPGVIFK